MISNNVIFQNHKSAKRNAISFCRITISILSRNNSNIINRIHYSEDLTHFMPPISVKHFQYGVLVQQYKEADVSQ